MVLVISPQSRSKISLNISPNSPLQKIKPGWIEAVAYFKKGPVQNNTIVTLSENLIKSIKPAEISSSKQWTWKGEGKNQQCM